MVTKQLQMEVILLMDILNTLSIKNMQQNWQVDMYKKVHMMDYGIK